jgi:hypothetical protein
MESPGSVAQIGRVAFELSRFEVVGDRCQIEGQWFGVRGRRFMRPALIVVVDGRPMRLLADLADKPWAVKDGEPWKATFPYPIETAESREAELTVSPDVTIALPAPRRAGGAARKNPTPRRAHVSRQAGERRGRVRSEPSGDPAVGRLDRPRRQSAPSELADQRGEANRPTQEPAELREGERRLRGQLQRVEAELARTAQRLDEVSRELREVAQERAEANEARDLVAAELEAVQSKRSDLAAERDTAVRERDRIAAERQTAQRTHVQALQASEAAGVARERALSERGAARAEQRRAVSERDAATATRDQALAERDAALSLRDQALAERNAAVTERDEAVSARETLAVTNERLQSELSDLLSARGAALVMRRAAQTSAVSRRYGKIIPAVITIAAVLAVVLIAVILLRVA